MNPRLWRAALPQRRDPREHFTNTIFCIERIPISRAFLRITRGWLVHKPWIGVLH